ncbi:hypothetical protein GCM10010271_02690 [Streptomyces kurssanovii]|nr:hypothetical protein GCM10010271_02690 [Streptomyces kurssanovii]
MTKRGGRPATEGARLPGPQNLRMREKTVWPDRATARAEVFIFTETFCNRRLRKHRTFGHLTPARQAAASAALAG